MELVKRFAIEKLNISDVADIDVKTIVNSIKDVWQGAKYASELPLIFLNQFLGMWCLVFTDV